MKQRLAIILATLALAACETNDCTLYNLVAMYSTFYRDGNAVALNDTLTVTACGAQSVLLNKAVGASRLTLPVSFWQAEDTLVLTLKGSDYMLRDTVWIEKANQVHYESPDCPTTLFHEIKAVRSTHEFINAINIIRPAVNYETTDNLQILLHPASL